VTTAAERVRQRLRYLRNWELANVVLIPVLVAIMWSTTGDPAAEWRLRAIGMLFVSYLLLQGGVYWHLKLRAVCNGDARLPRRFVPAFATLRRSNPWLIGVATVYVAVGDRSAVTADRAWGLAILAFAYCRAVSTSFESVSARPMRVVGLPGSRKQPIHRAQILRTDTSRRWRAIRSPSATAAAAAPIRGRH